MVKVLANGVKYQLGNLGFHSLFNMVLCIAYLVSYISVLSIEFNDNA